MLNISAEQILALLGKSIWKIANYIFKLKDQQISDSLNLENSNENGNGNGKTNYLKTDNLYFKDMLRYKKIHKNKD